MADRPLFIAAYREDAVIFQAGIQANTPLLAFTPGSAASRLHAVAIACDHDAEMTVEFGFAETLSVGVAVNIVPGTVPASDPFTLSRLDGGSWITNGWKVRDVATLDASVVVGNRGDFRISAVTASALTLANPGMTPVQQLGVSIDVWRWSPLWSLPVPARSGMDGNPAVSGLDPTRMPWLDADEPWLVTRRALWLRVPGNSAANLGNLFVSLMGGDY